MQRRFFTAFQLKILALLLMLVDHIGVFIPDMPIVLRYLGRLSAPLFIFCMVWGLDYTRDRRKYLLRLYVAGVSMSILWVVLRLLVPGGYHGRNNIFVTLFTSAAILHILSWKKAWWKKISFILIWQMIATFLCILSGFSEFSSILSGCTVAITGSMFMCEGGLPFVILTILLYYMKNSRIKLGIAYSGYCLICEIVSATALFARGMYFIAAHFKLPFFQVLELLYEIVAGDPFQRTPIVPHGFYWGDYQWMMIGALPFMLLYNQKKGRGWKYLFYIFYPLHIAILYLISVKLR